MYFLEQIKGQFVTNIVLYAGIEWGKWVEQEEQVKPVVEWWEASQAQKLASQTAELWDKMERKTGEIKDMWEKLKGKESWKDEKEIPSISSKEALATVEPKSSAEQEMAQRMEQEWATPEEVKEAIFSARLDDMSKNKLSLWEEAEITEALFMDSVVAENVKIDPQMFREARALWIIDMEWESSEEIMAKVREWAWDFADMMDFAEENGLKSPTNKEELAALYQLFQKEGNTPMSADEIAKLPKDENGNPISTIDEADFRNGQFFKPPSSSTRYEGAWVWTSYWNGKSGTMEGVSNIDSSELLPFVDKIAKKLNVEPAAVKAVVSVESAGKINATRFEPHIFERAQNGKYGPGDRKMLATSYGAFQIMWFNYKISGFDSVEQFVEWMKTPEWQMDAFAGFIEWNPRIHKALQQKDWPTFAHGYNGPAYKQNNYDNKMAAAYNKYSREWSAPMV